MVRRLSCDVGGVMHFDHLDLDLPGKPRTALGYCRKEIKIVLYLLAVVIDG